jgi:hypothetical protein
LVDGKGDRGTISLNDHHHESRLLLGSNGSTLSCGQDVSKEISNLKEFLIQQGKEIVKIKQENKVTRIGIFKQNV